jgi:hypothetical protein
MGEAGPPVDHDRVAVGVADVAAADIEPCLRRVGLGVVVQPAEEQAGAAVVGQGGDPLAQPPLHRLLRVGVGPGGPQRPGPPPHRGQAPPRILEHLALGEQLVGQRLRGSAHASVTTRVGDWEQAADGAAPAHHPPTPTRPPQATTRRRPDEAGRRRDRGRCGGMAIRATRGDRSRSADPSASWRLMSPRIAAGGNGECRLASMTPRRPRPMLRLIAQRCSTSEQEVHGRAPARTRAPQHPAGDPQPRRPDVHVPHPDPIRSPRAGRRGGAVRPLPGYPAGRPGRTSPPSRARSRP